MIILDGEYTLKDFGLIDLQEQEHPLTPDFTNQTFQASGSDEILFMDSQMEGKPFYIPIGMVEYNRNVKQQKMREFARFWFDEFNKPREVKLSYDYEKEKFYTVRIRESLNPERLVNASRFVLRLMAYDGFSYTEEYAEDIVWGSETIDFQDNYLLGHEGATPQTNVTGPTTLDYYVDGLAVKPYITISGSANNLSLTNNGQVLTFPNFTNADWVIDCEEYEVYKNGALEYDSIKLRDFWLYEGNNSVAIDGDNINITISMKYRDRYL
jgi:phage-related protein